VSEFELTRVPVAAHALRSAHASSAANVPIGNRFMLFPFFVDGCLPHPNEGEFSDLLTWSDRSIFPVSRDDPLTAPRVSLGYRRKPERAPVRRGCCTVQQALRAP
jgi:hypothetical protein